MAVTGLEIDGVVQSGLAEPLPRQWEQLWGSPSPFYRRRIRDLKSWAEELARSIPVVDESERFGDEVGSPAIQGLPIHRWYYYKEAFSPRLPRAVVSMLGAGDTGHVADVFGGVATTALSLACDPRVARVTSVEYSPFAVFAGNAKLGACDLDPVRLRKAAQRLLDYEVSWSIDPPDLAAFGNREIFTPHAVAEVLTVRQKIRRARLSDGERQFFLLGLAAVLEDASGAMKDGRALRIMRTRQRRRRALEAETGLALKRGGRVRGLLADQWIAMIEDLEQVNSAGAPGAARVEHLEGDARSIERLRRVDGSRVFSGRDVGLFVSSPPYLNCIDYTEVYKVELWFLELIRTQEEFRDLRLGTLRSHPSVRFPHRPYLDELRDSPVVMFIEGLAEFVETNYARRGIGRMIEEYFADICEVLRQQLLLLEPGGHSVLVVGNSTFSRRESRETGVDELWRVPVMTDVIAAHLGLALGFDDAEIWEARELRPRNVQAGTARESLVVLRAPG